MRDALQSQSGRVRSHRVTQFVRSRLEVPLRRVQAGVPEYTGPAVLVIDDVELDPLDKAAGNVRAPQLVDW